MASQVFSFTAESEDLATFKVVDVDPTDESYCVPSAGHRCVKFDVLTSMVPGNALQIAFAFADCDANKSNAILGVTKYVIIDGSSSTRRSSPDNTSGMYVANMTSSMVMSHGLGPCIDARSSPRSGIRRIMLVGLIYSDLPGSECVVIATPTKIP